MPLRAESSGDPTPSIIGSKTAMIDGAPATVDRIIPTLGGKAGAGARRARTIDGSGQVINDAGEADDLTAAIIDCGAEMIDRGADTIGRGGRIYDRKSLPASRMQAPPTGRRRMVDGVAPPLDGNPGVTDREAAHVLRSASMMTRPLAPIDNDAATIDQ